MQQGLRKLMMSRSPLVLACMIILLGAFTAVSFHPIMQSSAGCITYFVLDDQPSSSGTINGQGNGYAVGYACGAQIGMQASASSGWVFFHWEDTYSYLPCSNLVNAYTASTTLNVCTTGNNHETVQADYVTTSDYGVSNWVQTSNCNTQDRHTSSHDYTVGDEIFTPTKATNEWDSCMKYAAWYFGWDPMLLKAEAGLETGGSYNWETVSGDYPCGGSSYDDHSFGLMQMTPNCISWFARYNGQIDTDTTQSDADWGNSAFNPLYNFFGAAQVLLNNYNWARNTFRNNNGGYCGFNNNIYIATGAYKAGQGGTQGDVSDCVLQTCSNCAYSYVDSILLNPYSWSYKSLAADAGLNDPYTGFPYS